MMKTFLIRTGWFALVGTVPFLLILVTYVVLDPFKVVRDYDPIYTGDVVGEVNLNRAYIGTVTLLNNYQKTRYDSFVFGNSRSFIYGTEDWKNHLPPGSICYHYNAPAEALYGIVKKVEFLDRKGLSVNNALLLLDNATLGQEEPSTGHMYIIPPQLVDYENFFDFHLASFKAFVKPVFFRAYIDFKITGEVKPYMVKGGLLNRSRRKYNIVSNELKMDYYEELIAKGEYYTPEVIATFYERDSIETLHPKLIQENQKELLEAICRVFEKHGTDCKIIISPGWDQKKLHPDDLAYLKTLFGEDRVFDFSGKNQYSEDYRNHYEQFHYRPTVARDIMNEVYSKGDLL